MLFADCRAKGGRCLANHRPGARRLSSNASENVMKRMSLADDRSLADERQRGVLFAGTSRHKYQSDQVFRAKIKCRSADCVNGSRYIQFTTFPARVRHHYTTGAFTASREVLYAALPRSPYVKHPAWPNQLKYIIKLVNWPARLTLRLSTNRQLRVRLVPMA